MQIIDVKLSLIKINPKKRIRQDLGDLSALQSSIAAHGLFNPLVLSSEYELLAGHRRLESLKRLGFENAPCLIVQTTSILDKFEIEVEENMVRKEFTMQEIEEMLRRKKELTENRFWKKIWYKIMRFWQWLKEKFSS